MTARGTPRKILFLIADTGAGHRSAANALAKALCQVACQSEAEGGRRLEPEIHIVDAFAECSRFPLRTTMSLYGPATKYSPRLYGQIFRMTNSAERFSAAYRLCQPLLRQGLRELFERMRPDLIVSVHPLLNHVTLQVLQDIDIRIPVVTVVTDLVSIHVSWFASGVTACVVPTAEACARALAEGVPPKRVHLLGMPIDPIFAEQPSTSVAERRVALGLRPDLPTVLVVGGGEGAGGLADAVAALASRKLNAQLLVVTGRNRQLYAHLERLKATFLVPTHVYGYVRNMPELMRAADVIVTKAGPGTIHEAMACGLPIVLSGAIPGQEEGNVDFVLENGLGVLAESPEQLDAHLSALLDPANPLSAEIQARVRELSRPEASSDIARLLLRYLSQRSSASLWAARRRRPARVTTLLVRSRRSLRTRGSALVARRGRMRHQVLRPFSSIAPRLRVRAVAPSTALVRLGGARKLLVRGTQRGKVQLWRSGSR